MELCQNVKPEMAVLIDLETQSPVNLKTSGTQGYINHPDTRLLSLVAKRGKRILVWAVGGRYPGRTLALKPGECWPDDMQRDGSNILLCDDPTPPQLLREWAASNVFVAHNAAGFDAPAWEKLVAPRFNLSSPRWYDTIHACRAAGLPGSLEALGHIFMGTGKHAGKNALKLMYTAKMRGSEVSYPVGTLPLWKQLLQYNVKDVLLLERVFVKTLGFGEPDIIRVHQTINDRGLHFDRDLLHTLINLWTELEGWAMGEVSRLTTGELTCDNIRSPQAIKKWLAKNGVTLDSIKRDQLERFYEFPQEFFDDQDSESLTERHALLCEVLLLRQTVTRISKAKLQRITEMADHDNRVRNVLVYHGAHTGRWSGRGFQPHNLARGVADLDCETLLSEPLTLQRIRDAAAACKGNPRVDDVLSTILRPIFNAEPGNTLLIADYAAIEGRGVAWVADEYSLLEVFAEGGDVYCKMASVIYGRDITKKDKIERQVGKITVLGCGYSMSAMKFSAFCKASRIDLTAANTSAEACVEAYRSAYPAIAGTLQGQFRRGGIWQNYQKACRRAIETGRPQAAGKCVFHYDAGDLHIELPSGRRLIYRCASVEPRVPPYAALLGLALDPKPTIVYTHHHGYEASLYGGLITENIVQAICRDLLAWALVACESAGIPTVIHVHDEIVSEVPETQAVEALSKLLAIMSTPPIWAGGFPITVEGFSCPRYSKSPFSTSRTGKASNGIVSID